MSKKIDRATHGPSWSEIILGIFLSLGLGIVLSAALLMIKPVVVAKEMPKEPEAGVVYYLEGGREAGKARQASAKRAAFAQGQSISVIEEELNTLVAAPAAPTPAAKPGEAPPPAAGTLATGTPNFRIHNGSLQIAVPVTVNAAGLSQKLTVVAQGKFAKQGDRFVFDPESMYLGSCPLHRLPFVAGYVRSQFIDSQSIPEDLAAAWPKLANVAIEGNTLTLTMP